MINPTKPTEHDKVYQAFKALAYADHGNDFAAFIETNPPIYGGGWKATLRVPVDREVIVQTSKGEEHEAIVEQLYHKCMEALGYVSLDIKVGDDVAEDT